MNVKNKIIRVAENSVACTGSKPPLDHPVVYIPLNPQTLTHCTYCNQAYIQSKKK